MLLSKYDLLCKNVWIAIYLDNLSDNILYLDITQVFV